MKNEQDYQKYNQEYLEKLDLQIKYAKKQLVFKNTFWAYYHLFYTFLAVCLMFIFVILFFVFSKKISLKIYKDSKIIFDDFLFDFYRDKVMRASIKFYKISKRITLNQIEKEQK